MIEKNFLWQSENGMHARPAGMIVKEASKFGSEINIDLNKKTADAKSIFSLMGLGIKKDDKIKLTITGGDEDEASSCLEKLLEENSLALKI